MYLNQVLGFYLVDGCCWYFETCSYIWPLISKASVYSGLIFSSRTVLAPVFLFVPINRWISDACMSCVASAFGHQTFLPLYEHSNQNGHC